MVGRHSLFWCLQQAGLPRHKLASLPDFLVISPPKTGSTWLAENLRRHPGLFLPPNKELKYFSTFGDWLPLEWYLDHFAAAGTRRKGEASPSYALLTEERIRLVRDLMPGVKLVFLMRDPVARAWSHARHTFRFGEAAFAGRSVPLDQVTDDDWRESFSHPWLRANNDYVGQLARWANAFPREQLHVGFYEDIQRRPEGLLRDLFAFLGAAPDVPLEGFPLRDRILEGMEVPLTPGLERSLRRLLHRHTIDLVTLLRDRFHLAPPPEWDWWREPLAPGQAGPPPPEDALALEAAFPSARCVVGEHHGYQIVCNRGRFFAVTPALAPGRPELMPANEWRWHAGQGRCFEADTLAGLKLRIDRHLLERHEATRRELEMTREQLGQLASRLEALEATVERRCPARGHMARWLRGTLGTPAG